MKKILAFLLCVAMLVTPALAAGGEDQKSELTVGTTTPFSGAFATEAWGSNASDMDVRELIHGYELASWDSKQSTFIMNPTVVDGFVARDLQGKGHTYTITLWKDLKWSDGTPITAWDYAFSILLSSAPVIGELGGSSTSLDQIEGVKKFREGKAKTISGVSVVDDTTLRITMDTEYEPHFFYMGLFYIKPYPIQEIAPGCTVKDDGRGVYLNGNTFVKASLEKNLLDPKTGYLSHPGVVSGPYMLKEYDADKAEVTLEINPYFKGDVNGDKPSIQKLVFRYIPSDQVVTELKNGNVDLMNRVVAKDSIDELRKVSDLKSVQYPRSGLTFLSFSCERDTVSDISVRQAIAYCFDSEAFAKELVGDYGESPRGFYGDGQWMVMMINDQLEVPGDMNAAKAAELKALNMDSLHVYGVDTDAAAKLLDNRGWKLNADGIRSKTINGKTVTLDLVLAYPEGSPAEDVFPATLKDNLEKVGIQLTLKAVEPTELLRLYYRQDERDCDIIFIGSNFNTVYDPAENFALEDEYQGVFNRTGWRDEALYYLAVQMRRSTPGDLLGYCRAWLNFQRRLMNQVPVIPAYTNDYFDFHIPALKNYNIASYQTWSKAIVAATLEA